MTTEALEQKLSNDKHNEFRLWNTIDVYTESTAVLYTGPALGTPGLTPINAGFNTTDYGIRPPPWERQTTLQDYGAGSYNGGYMPDHNKGNYWLESLKERQTTLPEYGIGDTTYGLLDKEDYTGCVDLPSMKAQFHFHGSDSTTITHGRFKDYNINNIGPRLNGYESAMADYLADQLNFNKHMKK